MTGLTPGTDTTTRFTKPPGGPLRRVWAGLRNFWTGHVKTWIVVLVALIGAVLIWAVSANIKDVDRRVRDADRREALSAVYAADLRAYDSAVFAREACVAAVEYDALNRDQHLASIRGYELLLPFTPPAYQTGIQTIIAEMRAGKLLASPPRTVEECPPVPVAPPAPDVNGAP